MNFQAIRLILSDVDGVLTDGGIIYDGNGLEHKRFHVRDGYGIRLWQKSGGEFGIVTGRNCRVVDIRAAELKIKIVHQGVSDKLKIVKEIAASLGIGLEHICFIGDDFPDLAVIRNVGIGVAVPEAPVEVLNAADIITHTSGGHGAVRELIETILKNQNRWNDLVTI